MEVKKRPVGKPTKYREEYCDELIKHMSQGLSFESFGGHVGVSKQTLYDWEKKHPEFVDAKSRGLMASLLYWEKIGIAGTIGQLKTIAKEIIKPNGTVKKFYTRSAFSAVSWNMNMKNRFGWKDRQETEIISPDGSLSSHVTINIPSNGKEKRD